MDQVFVLGPSWFLPEIQPVGFAEYPPVTMASGAYTVPPETRRKADVRQAGRGKSRAEQ